MKDNREEGQKVPESDAIGLRLQSALDFNTSSFKS